MEQYDKVLDDINLELSEFKAMIDDANANATLEH